MAPAKPPVETKVKAATGAAGVVGLVITILNSIQADSTLLGSAPPWVQALVTLIVPPVCTFLVAWQAKHTPRLDAPRGDSGREST